MFIEFNGVAQETTVIGFERGLLGQRTGTAGKTSQSFGVEQQLSANRLSGDGDRTKRQFNFCREYPTRVVARVAPARSARFANRAFDPVTRSQGAL